MTGEAAPFGSSRRRAAGQRPQLHEARYRLARNVLPAGATPVGRHRFRPNVAYDLSLQHPRCVYQLLKQQYSRYTPEMVERITGIPKDQLPEGRRPVHVDPQGRRHEEGRHHHLRRRLDAAQLSERRSSARRPCCNC